jgi:hypothetical protein
LHPSLFSQKIPDAMDHSNDVGGIARATSLHPFFSGILCEIGRVRTFYCFVLWTYTKCLFGVIIVDWEIVDKPLCAFILDIIDGVRFDVRTHAWRYLDQTQVMIKQCDGIVDIVIM